MNKIYLATIFFGLASCTTEVTKDPVNDDGTKSASKEEVTEVPRKIDLLNDFEPLTENGHVNAVIEIPAGTMDKWELNKKTGEVEWEKVDGVPREVNYIGYPGNYGMIPGTLLSKENGGDGDPLDVLVLGPPANRGEVIPCKLIGVLYLSDRGEQDDKLIAIAEDAPFNQVNSIAELDSAYAGITSIIQTWFTSYKGPDKITSAGFGNEMSAREILTTAIEEFDN